MRSICRRGLNCYPSCVCAMNSSTIHQTVCDRFSSRSTSTCRCAASDLIRHAIISGALLFDAFFSNIKESPNVPLLLKILILKVYISLCVIFFKGDSPPNSFEGCRLLPSIGSSYPGILSFQGGAKSYIRFFFRSCQI